LQERNKLREERDKLLAQLEAQDGGSSEQMARIKEYIKRMSMLQVFITLTRASWISQSIRASAKEKTRFKIIWPCLQDNLMEDAESNLEEGGSQLAVLDQW
jgi:LPS sulfotransferase NodH